MNPFTVLGLGVEASSREVSRQGKRLSTATSNEEELRAVSAAVEALNTHPMVRLTHEFFEVPNTAYRNPDWERFARGFRRSPIGVGGSAEHQPPSIHDFDVAALLELVLQGWLDAPMPPLGPALDHAPVDLGSSDGRELDDDLFG